ncbi:MAG TPA: dinitrogenase iron-molybdenum cofactor biosynthesis protein [Chloroflexi bacterium]|nr:dinitrogenase iron-molybdenum cofactor biosynthesis protein [Chloroflexota bacterium]
MKIAISASSASLDSPVDPRFGRCPYFLLVDAETEAFEALPNASAMSGGGAGIQAAQIIVQQGVQLIITGNVGPNAFRVFETAGVAVLQVGGMTAREALAAFKSGQLTPVGSATQPDHAGMRGAPAPPPPPPSAQPVNELDALKAEVAELRQAVAALLEQVEKLLQS